MEKFKDLKTSIKRWNKESFGDISELKQEKKGFGKKWRKWIWGCLQSANFLIMINGKPMGHLGYEGA